MRATLDRLQAARRDQSGFTLIELLIVIVILGVLAAVVVFSVRGINNNSTEAACKANVSTAETAVEAFYAQKSRYPDDLGEAVTEGFLKSDPSDTDVDEAVRVVYAVADGSVVGANGDGC
ncbi:prepilin-type N-terminal cleavage/methylation domain-containing protein [Nocardioides sp. GY 10113]|uniref:competence type IV pilus major pilin ComGC n=1 Tax=Nocardioides sp. GY 10113 TaxID=2569761 RepID=UPI0010A824C8|nr:prepilin-type N-terminal cleavage/methylation domain-containing protein [Nocardioides sp. GY 10113]TIC88845.1 prepilin-type N-terminal cleavage/methylation domain-containing protein [Nocardioides sp. GY 10113]